MNGVMSDLVQQIMEGSDHPNVVQGKVGLLLVNLGTPDGVDFWSIRRYLKEFLSDRRVIETNPIIWKLVLNLIILTFRPAKAGKAYQEVWLKDTDESPLRAITRQQAEKLSTVLNSDQIIVDWAMRYGNPSIKERLACLKEVGCDRIAVIPLYPQYSATTTATVNDEVFRYLMNLRWQPTIRLAEPYYADAAYIKALAASYRAHLESLSWEPEVLLASFHGLPKKYHTKGDPYYCHCHKTARLLRDELGMNEQQCIMAFQSRFGPEEWLTPYMDATIDALIQQGVQRIAVITPGFAADCVETLEEIAIGLKEHFYAAGGKEFTVVPALNDSAEGVGLLAHLSNKALSGWVS